MAISGEEFRQLVSNCVCYIRKKYNSFTYIIDGRSLYRIECRILNTHPKYLPIGFQKWQQQLFPLIVEVSKPTEKLVRILNTHPKYLPIDFQKMVAIIISFDC